MPAERRRRSRGKAGPPGEGEARREAKLAGGAAPAEPLKLEEPFEWEKAEGLGLEQRVIAINLTELRNGNPRYNVVVRDRDVINVPSTPAVLHHGEVNRPGVFAFGGREITVKQAWPSAGLLGMAWPQRCELIRREPEPTNSSRAR